MPLPKQNIYTTKQIIADLLSFKNNHEVLSNLIRNTDIDWETIVVIASKHLMLPALYCQLKRKGLLPLIPVDLSSYLQEIANINRGRNEILLKEAHEISKLFNQEHIDHVFIKGIALLAGHVFEDPAERMIGDIDILVAPEHLDRAFDLLTRHGYTDILDPIIKRKNHRHLPRQISQQKFGAIELHSNILIHQYKTHINNIQILKNKRLVDGIAVTAVNDAIRIAILALQINDRAHFRGYLNFRTIYDCLALNLPTNKTMLKNLADNPFSQSFLQLSSVFFEVLTPYKTSYYSKLLKANLRFGLKHPKLGHLMWYTRKTIRGLYFRITLIASNKRYREHILKNKLQIKKK